MSSLLKSSVYCSVVVYYLQLLCFFRFHHKLVAQNSDPVVGSSICVLPSGERSTLKKDCTAGEVQLIGRYLHLGIHNVGSFGTKSTLDSTYYTNQLGLIADYDRNGFSNSPSPGFAGDYFIPGAPIEGIFCCPIVLHHCDSSTETARLCIC